MKSEQRLTKDESNVYWQEAKTEESFRIIVRMTLRQKEGKINVIAQVVSGKGLTREVLEQDGWK